MLNGISRDELANALTHGIGALLSVVGLAVLAYRSVWSGDLVGTIGVSVYGLSAVSVFTSSTLYHVATLRRLKSVFLWLDHSCGYALIAGTYTPFMLSVLRGSTGIAMLCAIWSLAIAGILAKTVRKLRSDLISLPFYLAMGWLILVVLRPFASQIAPSGLVLLLAGGLCFSAGLVFFVLRWTYAHAVWHVFVLAGAALHYVSVLFYAQPV